MSITSSRSRTIIPFLFEVFAMAVIVALGFAYSQSCFAGEWLPNGHYRLSMPEPVGQLTPNRDGTMTDSVLADRTLLIGGPLTEPLWGCFFMRLQGMTNAYCDRAIGAAWATNTLGRMSQIHGEMLRRAVVCRANSEDLAVWTRHSFNPNVTRVCLTPTQWLVYDTQRY